MPVKVLLIATSLFAIVGNVFWLLPPIVLRGVFWAMLALAVLLPKGREHPSLFAGGRDTLLALITAVSTLILVLRWEAFASGIHDATLLENLAGVAMVLLILEITRRVIGWFLVSVIAVFLLYALFGNYVPGVFVTKGYSIPRLVAFLFWDTTGIYGLPMYIAASYVMLFVIFGSLLLACGGEKWFMDLSYAAVGRFRGGPAMTAVLSSALFGMMSGSPVANVVTTGSFTIPLMKRMGYRPEVAGAIEAVASTGGMFTPPIMGAAAFLMAEYVGVPYLSVAMAAAIPAVLFYLCLMITIYLRARKRDLPAMGGDELPHLGRTMKQYGHLSPPIFILLVLLFYGWSLLWAAFWSIASLVILATLRRATRMSPLRVGDALEDAAQKAIPVTVACAAAGIIYGVISLTGLGFRVSSVLLGLAGHSEVLVLVFTMLSALLLGFAMPPTAAYIILAALVIPSLKEIGLPLLVAHMFLFIFCSIGPITPPVALAAYSAAGLADSDPNRTGIVAFRFGLSAFLIPFLFAYTHELLLIGTLGQILSAVIHALIGLFLLTVAIEGCFLTKLGWSERGVLVLAALAVLSHHAWIAPVGAVAAAILFALNHLRWRKEKAEEPALPDQV